MAKKIRNPKEIRIVYEDGTDTLSAHYGLSCDEYPELEIRKGIPITLPAEALTTLWTRVNTQINAHEGIV